MSRDSAIRRGRIVAEDGLTDKCTVRRATGNTVRDPETYEDVPEMAVIHTGLSCKVKFSGTEPHAVQTPGQTVVKSSPEWHVPMPTLGVLTDDVVTIDSVDADSGDPDMVGKTYRVAGPFAGTYATARRFPIEEVS